MTTNDEYPKTLHVTLTVDSDDLRRHAQDHIEHGEHGAAHVLLAAAAAMEEPGGLPTELDRHRAELGRWRTLFGTIEQGIAVVEEREQLRRAETTDRQDQLDLIRKNGEQANQLAGARSLLSRLRCLDRDDEGRARCDRVAVAVPWGTLYEKDQVGPKCAEHLLERHPDLGVSQLALGALSGASAVVFLDELHAVLGGV
jgi:hypothetical protein